MLLRLGCASTTRLLTPRIARHPRTACALPRNHDATPSTPPIASQASDGVSASESSATKRAAPGFPHNPRATQRRSRNPQTDATRRSPNGPLSLRSASSGDDSGVGDFRRELRLLDVGSDARVLDLTLDDRLLKLVASSGSASDQARRGNVLVAVTRMFLDSWNERRPPSGDTVARRWSAMTGALSELTRAAVPQCRCCQHLRGEKPSWIRRPTGWTSRSGFSRCIGWNRKPARS